VSRIVIVGLSQVLSDIVDCALARGDEVVRVLVDEAPDEGPRDLPWAERLAQWRRHGVDPAVQPLSEWQPHEDERVILGPSSPARLNLVARLQARHGPLRWARLVHPAAQVSRLAELNDGCFIGAGAIVAAGARLGEQVFVNRGASIGHDTRLADGVRLQPRATLAGLVTVGRGCTVGMSATVLERLQVGAHASIAAGALVTRDVAEFSLVAGAPARHVRTLAPTPDR
jgi:sugar O-acyltransferase (sialic acid O-acetyltransferase NeuD family)